MKPLKLMTLFFLTSSWTLHAYDLSDFQDTNTSCQLNRTNTIPIPKKNKTSETKYEKIERKLFEYKGNMFKDMLTYSVDMFVPDEMARSVKDVLTNRQKKGFTDTSEKIPQFIFSDSLNVALTTSYYYMQDMGRISERLWKNVACNPEFFEYDESIEPKRPLLNLSECDAQARGVSKNGIVLPFNKNFPNALYPYASKPDGCSAEGLQDLYDQSNDLSNDDKWLEKVCDAHDECYYTEGTTADACNSKFIVQVLDACNHIETKDTLKYLGMKNAFCSMKGFMVASGANACARRYFANAQKKQRAYNLWVKKYEKAYIKAKKQQKGQP